MDVRATTWSCSHAQLRAGNDWLTEDRPLVLVQIVIGGRDKYLINGHPAQQG